jgi:hypothetical protein
MEVDERRDSRLEIEADDECPSEAFWVEIELPPPG